MVCVKFDDLLALALPHNRQHLDDLLVVTTPWDEATKEQCRKFDCRIFETEAFYDDGADFNKGKAVEQAVDTLRRQGHILIFDADIVFPADMRTRLEMTHLHPAALYGVRRRQCDDLATFKKALADWDDPSILQIPDQEIAGYYQLFHTADPRLRRRPWYTTDWRHAGGSDSDFHRRWRGQGAKRWIENFHVMHLGDTFSNWCGRSSDRWLDVPGSEGGLSQEEAADRNNRLQDKRASHKGFDDEKL